MGESFLSVGTHKKLNDSVRSERVSGKRTGFGPAHHACTLHEVSYVTLNAATDAEATAPHTSPSHETQLTSLCWVTPTCKSDSKHTSQPKGYPCHLQADRKVTQAISNHTQAQARAHSSHIQAHVSKLTSQPMYPGHEAYEPSIRTEHTKPWRVASERSRSVQ